MEWKCWQSGEGFLKIVETFAVQVMDQTDLLENMSNLSYLFGEKKGKLGPVHWTTRE